MDYAVGSVAALISGNVTPNRPRLIRRALTPTKHQSSPNVTPKSECVDDRSIFLSPSLQKKKAIVKKSPKRIFQDPNLDLSNDIEGISTLSPKADKVKKHLKEDLEAEENTKFSPKSPKSPKKGKGQAGKSIENEKEKSIVNNINDETQNENESTPTKKKQRNSINMETNIEKENIVAEVETKTSKKKRKSQTTEDTNENIDAVMNNNVNKVTPKKKKKKSESQSEESSQEQIKQPSQEKNQENAENQQPAKKKKKKNKKKKNKAKLENKEASITQIKNQDNESTETQSSPKKKNKIKNEVNPNAITNKDTDSEHESDDEINSENELTNNQILDTGPAESSEDEEEKIDVKKTQKKEKTEKSQESSDEVMRTLFVGNVPFSPKCKKEIKSIFNKYGQIQTVRIRTVPVKDARVTPKLAVIKNELHPERTTVNVYIKFEDASSVNKALAENNKVLNGCHLRVTPSDSAGTEHDPHKAIFVGNLPFAIEDDTLRAKFDKCGEIESVRVIRDNKTNAGKGFGYVNFASKDGVELALAMTEEDLTIKNRILRIKRCTTTKKPGFKSNQNNGPPGNRPGRSQGVKQRNHEGRNQSIGRNQGSFGRDQGSFGKQGRFGSQGSVDRSKGEDGAHRRILKKRQHQEGGGPPSKRPNISQPKEKKQRKEFVGMTSEKKKKHKFNKGDKKKKVLSEILTKYN